MEINRQLAGRYSAPETARRILVVVHGREPARWELEVSRALMGSPQATVRVVALTDVPSPPSAALLPAARRARVGARAEWRRLEEAHVAGRLEALLAHLPAVPDVAWGADLIVVGLDRASRLQHRLLGAIHERVVARATCAVLVMSRPERGPARAW